MSRVTTKRTPTTAATQHPPVEHGDFHKTPRQRHQTNNNNDYNNNNGTVNSCKILTEHRPTGICLSLTSAAASGSNGPFARFRRPQLFDRRPHPQPEPAGSGRDRSSSHTDSAFRRLKKASRVAALPAAGVTSGSDRITF